jgi:hypothetical protein
VKKNSNLLAGFAFQVIIWMLEFSVLWFQGLEMC